ncbi:MAG TPA: hypothetical protein VNH11_10645 [Pirellulales bacterium]|nr:hypothetical protein [Pirellulales bacterium]
MATKKKKYTQASILQRLEALFLDNVGRIVTRERILEVAADPVTGKIPENWHQRLSELRVEYGYTIQSSRDTQELKRSEYRLVSAERRTTSGRRVKIAPKTWQAVLERARHSCEWEDGGVRCGLKAGEQDPIGGGTVKLTADHKTPHSMNPQADAHDPNAWQALCGRHQVVKKNFWDHATGKLNVYAIVQAAPEREKRAVYDFLREYFGD